MNHLFPTYTFTKEQRLHFANALVAIKLEWNVGEDSKKIWKEFVRVFQEGKEEILIPPRRD